jgi:hypothetical protein
MRAVRSSPRVHAAYGLAAPREYVLDVSDQKRGDLAYFDRLHHAIDKGEVAAFLAHLLAMDLSGFKVRAVPSTRVLNRQKLVGADSVTVFWNDCLREGVILGEGGTSWPADVVTQVLHACYLEHARDHGGGGRCACCPACLAASPAPR